MKGLKIGILKEGFSAPNMQAGVVDKVKAGANRFAALGATVNEISIPEHLTALAAWNPVRRKSRSPVPPPC